MTLFIPNDLDLQPSLPAHCQHYSTCVANATTQLQQCTQHVMSALQDRVVGLTKCANFEAAIRDAKVLQHLLPSSAASYLCAATVYIEQGRQLDAVDICNSGLAMVDKSDPEYHRLEKVKADAKQRDRRRIDFMKQLPVDVVVTVLAPVLLQNTTLDAMIPCPYLQVSRLWRDRIIKASRGALRFIITSDQEDDTYHQLDALSHHARSLRVTRCSRAQWLRDLLTKTDLRSLMELQVDAFIDSDYTRLRLALPYVSSTLTHLSISLPNGYPPPVPSFLVICPHLISLQVFEAYDIDLRLLPRMVTFPNLKTLRLDCTVGQITHEKVLAMLHRFPSLKHLALNPCPDPRSISVIQQHCPLLKSLALGICIVGANLPRDQNNDYQQDGVKGLQRLYLCGTQETRYIWNDVHGLLNQHRKTLEQIDLNVTVRNHDEEDLNITLPCPRLKKLSLHHMSLVGPCLGWWLSACAPCLEEFHLTTNVIMSNPAVLDTIPPKLHTLRIRLDTIYIWNPQPDIKDYVCRLTQKPCPLKTLEIHFNSTTYGIAAVELVKAVAQLDHLQHLILGFSQDIDMMEPYLTILAKGCQHLTRLEIKYNNVPAQYSLASLLQLPQLKQLTLPVVHGATATFWEPLVSFPQLRCLALYPENAALSLDLERFKEKRPRVKVVLLEKFESFSTLAASLV